MSDTAQLLGSILVVDDDPESGDVLSACLSSIGYQVTTARDGISAIDKLKRESFDLVITDLNMPQVNGIDLLETIKDAGLGEDVLIVSGTSSVSKAVQAMRAGALTYLEKPIDPEQLKVEVRTALRQRRQRMAHHAQRLPPTLISASRESVGVLLPAPGTTSPMTTGDRALGDRATGERGSVRGDALAASGDRVRPPPLPPQVGRYRVERVLGTGGMGVVYDCFDPALSRRCAVKVLSLHHLAPDRRQLMVERFSREAQAAGRLLHPNVVTIYDFGELPEVEILFLAMQLASGVSLQGLLEAEGRLSWTRVVHIAFQVADALAYAHAEGVIHRDVKHANIMVGEGDFTQLLDFGIAKLRDSDLTAPGAFVGSPGYLSPEVLLERPIDFRVDQYALGTVMIEALAGQRLYSSEHFQVIARRILDEETPSFAALGIDAPPELEQLVRRLHDKSPEKRFADERELIEALGEIGRASGLPLHSVRPLIAS